MTGKGSPHRTFWKRRSSSLVVVVLPTEILALQVYRLLQYHGISPENLAIVGAGYNQPESIGLVRPLRHAQCQAGRFGGWAFCLGCLLGLSLALSAKMPLVWVLLKTLWVGGWSGIWGLAIGTLTGWLCEGRRARIYRHHVQAGGYLLLVEGPHALVHLTQEILSHHYTPRSESEA